MEPISRPIDPFNAKLPGFSADWRFLLPIQDDARILILTESGGDFRQHFLGLRIQVITWQVGKPLASKGEGTGKAEAGTRDYVAARTSDPPFPSSSFDLAAIPFGIPVAHSEEHHRMLKSLLKPGGRLLIGFANPWAAWRDSRGTQLACMPSAFRRALERAGFEDLQIYGAVPNLAKPAYILPLRKRSLRFFAQSPHLGRRAGSLLRVLSPFSNLLPGLLPSYFIVGRA